MRTNAVIGGGTLIPPWLVLEEEVEELFEVVLTVFVIKVDEKRDGCQAEQFDLAALAVDLQVSDQSVLGCDFMVALEVVD